VTYLDLLIIVLFAILIWTIFAGILVLWTRFAIWGFDWLADRLEDARAARGRRGRGGD